MKTAIENFNLPTSSQDGDIGRYAVPPCTTKRGTTTNLKIRNNQNCQKIKLYGSLTTKELKKKHSSRLVGGAEMGSSWRTRCTRQQLADQTAPHLRGDKPGGTTGEQDRPHNPRF